MKDKHIHDLLEAYVLGALEGDEERTVEQHLSECAECRKLADEYASIAAMLPQALAKSSPLQPSPALKARLLERIEAQQTLTPGRSLSRRGVWLRTSPRRWAGSRRAWEFSSLAAMVLLVLLLAWVVGLNRALAHEQGLRARLMQQTELIFEVVDSDQSTRLFLRPSKEAPLLSEGALPPYGKLFTRADMPYVVAMTGRLAAPPPGKDYRLWLIGPERTELAGVMNVDANGFGSLVYQADRDGPVFESARLILQDADRADLSGTVVLAWMPEAGG